MNRKSGQTFIISVNNYLKRPHVFKFLFSKNNEMDRFSK